VRRYYWGCVFGLIIVLIAFLCGCAKPDAVLTTSPEKETMIELPEPQYDSDISIEQSLLQRRSIRSYTGESLTLQEVSQLMWAAQGVTSPRGFRTAPSAGALYPLQVYLLAGDVQDLTAGVYQYRPDQHQLIKVIDGDKRTELCNAALMQSCVKDGAVVLVFTGVYKRTISKYGDRGIRYVHIEVGHAAENLYLQATAMGLGMVTVGAFHDEHVAKLLNLPPDEHPLYIIPVGRKE